ncbi:hypothetical protein F0562_006676 [Nyssa sinensis]|uniref:Reverse transcriptase domain-containing protein n=1 Tax=Nyssa sinensis TaxID=561372 RepID=A0A5J5AMH4_9ASTE|nr:hypothetical protein F0562_006676 [Nyssa sinensis]
MLRQVVKVKVPKDDRHGLIQEITGAEIRKALFSINGDKSPGPNGYGAAFYHKKWRTVGPDLSELVDPSSLAIQKKVLEEFESMSGLKLNHAKSTAFFVGVIRSEKEQLLQIQEIAEGSLPDFQLPT